MNDNFSNSRMKPLPWQTEVWRRLTGRVQTLPHALLFRGRFGSGKGVFAAAFAQWLLCESRQAPHACGACPSCGWFAQGAHPDFHRIEPEVAVEQSDGDEAGARRSERKPRQHITVDQVRRLGDLVNVSSHRGGHRVVLIQPAEGMNVHAANALLKTLEEPPPGTIFLLVCHRPRRVLPTVLSRCEQVTMPMPDAAAAERWLQEQGVEHPVQPLAEAGFAPVAALALSAPEHQALRSRVMKILSEPAGLDAVAAADILQGTDGGTLVGWLQRWCYDLMRVRVGAPPRFNPDFSPALARLARSIGTGGFLDYNRMLTESQRIAQHPLNARLFAESLLLYYRRSFLSDKGAKRE